MPLSPEVEAARAQVFQQIGRNVLRFQQLELMLKSMVANSRLHLTDGNPSSAHERRIQEIQKKTLGVVSEQFFEEVISSQSPRDGQPAFFEESTVSENQVHISTTFKMHFPPEEHAAWTRRIKALVTERNDLVHTSLFRMDLQTLSGCQKALVALEEQGARVLAEIDYLKPIINGLKQSKKSLRAYLADDAFWEQLFPATT